MTTRKKILISGASGFIGTHLRHMLDDRGITYSLLMREPPSWPDNLGRDLDLSDVDSIVHLATPKIRETDSWTEIERTTLVPLHGLLDAIRKTNPKCFFVFVSSQSANQNTKSKYGRMKWQSEELLSSSKCNHVNIRPGLVIGKGSQGLFPTMVRMIQSSPIVPLVGNGLQLVQPIFVNTLIEAIINICANPNGHNRLTYNIAQDPITLRELLEKTARHLNKKRWFVCLPKPLVNAGLFIAEVALKHPPLTRVNLTGLLNLEIMETRSSCEWLQLQMPPLDQVLDQVLGESSATRDQSWPETEAKYLASSLFGLALDLQTTKRYREACALLPPPTIKDPDMQKIVRLGLDPEAIEFVLRKANTQLTKRIHILVYLLEGKTDCFDRFVNTNNTRLRALLVLSISGFRAVIKLLKGKYLLWRYHLV